MDRNIISSIVLTLCLSNFSAFATNDCDNTVSTWRPKSNIDRAMLGIDIAKMKPMPMKPELNPALKMPIFTSVYQDSNGLFQPYSFYSFSDNLICNPNFKEEYWNNMKDYILDSASSLMSDWSLGYQGPEASFDEFGATITPPPNSALDDDDLEGTKALEKFFQYERGSISRSTARCNVYDVSIDIQDSSLALTPNFMEAIKTIDKAASSEDKDLAMKQFISNFGTHFAKKSIMGIGIEFETRFNEKETIEYDPDTLKKCNTRSGKLSILGYQGPEPEVSNEQSEEQVTSTMLPMTTLPPYLTGYYDNTPYYNPHETPLAKVECEGSLNNTLIGKDTIIKRFKSSSYGTLPVTSSLSKWSTKVVEMHKAGTLQMVPIHQDLVPIFDLLSTKAVAAIAHEDGTLINITNVLKTSLNHGFAKYCKTFGCYIHDCSETVALDQDIFEMQDIPYNGKPTFKSEKTNNYLFYDKAWKVSPNFLKTKDILLQSAPCPQTGSIYVDPSFIIPPLQASNWQDCAKMCFELPENKCKFWQHSKQSKECALIDDYDFVQAVQGNDETYFTGARDCPGDKTMAKSPNGQCVENFPSKSMWIRKGNTNAEKDLKVEHAMDDMILIANGLRGHRMEKTFFLDELKPNSKYQSQCRIPDMPYKTRLNFIAVTSDFKLLSNEQEKVYMYVTSKYGRWDHHSTMNKNRDFGSAVTMPNKLIVMGGKASPNTMEVLEDGSNNWIMGPKIPGAGLNWGCAVKVSPSEIFVIGGINTMARVLKFNIDTEKWTTLSDLNRPRKYHSCAKFGEDVIVAGGKGHFHDDDYLLSTEIISIKTGKSRELDRNLGKGLNRAKYALGTLILVKIFSTTSTAQAHPYSKLPLPVKINMKIKYFPIIYRYGKIWWKKWQIIGVWRIFMATDL